MVADSPWAAPPSRHIPAPPNWGFYLLVNLGLSVLTGFLVYELQALANIGVPGAVVNIGVLFATVMIAGSRWLKVNGGSWTRQDRARLSLAYAVVNLVVSVIVIALMVAMAKAGYAAEMGLPAEALSLGLGPLVGIMGIALLIVISLAYVFTRLVLGIFVNSQARATGPDGKLL